MVLNPADISVVCANGEVQPLSIENRFERALGAPSLHFYVAVCKAEHIRPSMIGGRELPPYGRLAIAKQ